MKGKEKIGIIGLGLIGGSLAVSLRAGYTVVGCSHSADTVSYALENSIIDEAVSSYDGFADCIALFVCTPLSLVRKTVCAAQSALGDSVIITDVGSVKGMLEGLSGRIIGGHPMAGTEQSGVRAAKERLFENAYYILCDYNSNKKDLEIITEIIKFIGAKPIVMTASVHDALVSKISHLPHMLAYSLVTSALSGEESIVGSGFMDTTRIASSSPDFWNTVTHLNRDNIVKEMDGFLEVFKALRDKIADGGDISGFLQEAKDKRDKLSYTKRYMTEYVLYADVPDRVGSIADIVSKLSGAGISIGNLEVTNSREGKGGALRIELKDEASFVKAKEILL